MDDDLKLRLYNILNVLLEIENFFDNRPPEDFAKYQTDLRTKRAVKRYLRVINQTLDELLKAKPTINISYAGEIKEVGNRIIAHNSVPDEIIWELITKRLPVIKAEIESLLRN